MRLFQVPDDHNQFFSFLHLKKTKVALGNALEGCKAVICQELHRHWTILKMRFNNDDEINCQKRQSHWAAEDIDC